MRNGDPLTRIAHSPGRSALLVDPCPEVALLLRAACRANPGPVPQTRVAPRGRHSANRLVTSTRPVKRLPLKCHSPEGGTRFHVRKTFLTWSPLRNRTVDLLLTMYRSADVQPQAEQLTCRNTSTDRRSQAPGEPSQARLPLNLPLRLILRRQTGRSARYRRSAIPEAWIRNWPCGALLHQACKRAGLSEVDLAAQAGVTRARSA